MSTLQRAQHVDTNELLSTKLVPPRLRPSLVVREPLLARLNQAINYKLTLLSAPAGFGKTTLAAEWINQSNDEFKMTFGSVPENSAGVNDESISVHHASRSLITDHSRVAWFSLDAGDNDPARFWRYVITACRQFDPGMGLAALAQLEAPQPPFGAPQPPAFEAILTTLVNDLAQLPHPCVLVLDDYHLITEPQIHQTVAFLLDYLPYQIHVLLLSRSDLPLPLARLRARNELLELRLTDLRFSLEESRTFLQQALPTPLAPEAITLLHDRTEGWVTALHLVVLALQGRTDSAAREQFLATFTGKYRPLLEYLVSDVLSAQPVSVQTFLLQTSGLSRLTASLCDAVIGANDSDLLLAQIERTGLFLESLDGSGRWYRYHALFAEAMQQEARRRLDEERLRALARNASGWYEQQGMLAEAVEAALYAQDFAHAARLIEGHIPPDRLHESPEYHTLRRWLEQIPEEVLQQRPMLTVLYVMVHLFIPDHHQPANIAQLDTFLQQAEQVAQVEERPPLLGGILTLRALICGRRGNLPQAKRFACQARAYLSEGKPSWGGARLGMAEIVELLEGVLEPARLTRLEQYVLGDAASASRPAVRAFLPMLGNVYTMQGRLEQAAGCYRQTLASAGDDLADRAAALNGLAALSYEWNELEQAGREAAEALELSQASAYEALQVQAALTLVRTQYGRGQIEPAWQQLGGLLTRIDPDSTPQLYRAALACQVWLHLKIGDLVAAQQWLADRSLHPIDLTPLQQEQEKLLAARLLMAQDQGVEALRLLGLCEETALAHRRSRSVLEIMTLKALAYAALADWLQAKQTLRAVLSQAQPEGFRRLFLDEGDRMATLLETILPGLTEKPLSDYVKSLLTNFTSPELSRGFFSAGRPGDAGLDPDLPIQNLIEPLSPQEERVLRLLAAGHSNPEIAAEMIVSINTIKTQVQSIYRKLQVHNRAEARDAARRLRLF